MVAVTNRHFRYTAIRMLKTSVEVNGKEFTDIMSYGGSNEATYYLSEVVFVGDGLTDSTHDSYKGLDVAGKAVLIMPGKAAGGPRRGRNMNPGSNFVENARLHGAAVVLYCTNTVRGGRNFGGAMYTQAFKPAAGPICVLHFRCSGQVHHGK